MGIFPKNAEQAFAIDALLNDDIKLVSLVGKAGTGKTLLPQDWQKQLMKESITGFLSHDLFFLWVKTLASSTRGHRGKAQSLDAAHL